MAEYIGAGIVSHVSWLTERAGVWTREGQTRAGRLAVRLDDDNTLRIRSMGAALPAVALVGAVELALPDLLDRATALHGQRRLPWRMQVEGRPSGALEFYLEALRDGRLMDVQRVHVAHVSCAGSINEDIRIWLGDWVPLRGKMIDMYPEDKVLRREGRPSYEVLDPSAIYVWRASVPSTGGWTYPSAQEEAS